MEPMQEFAKDDGSICIEDLDRWPSASNAVGFLSTTTSTIATRFVFTFVNAVSLKSRQVPVGHKYDPPFLILGRRFDSFGST
jgi:hypothetical protein